MAFTSTGPNTGDVLSGLVALLSDPKASAAKLNEMKLQMADLDDRVAKATKAQSDSMSAEKKARGAEAALAKKEAELLAAEKALDDKMTQIDQKMVDLAHAQDVADKAKQGLQDQELALKKAQAESDHKNKMAYEAINNKSLSVDNKLAELERGKAELEKKEKRLDAQIELYDTKLAKLKNIMD